MFPDYTIASFNNFSFSHICALTCECYFIFLDNSMLVALFHCTCIRTTLCLHTCTIILILLLFCSDARNMARDVNSVLSQIVQERGHMSAEAAVDYIKKLQKRGRYLQDVWS